MHKIYKKTIIIEMIEVMEVITTKREIIMIVVVMIDRVLASIEVTTTSMIIEAEIIIMAAGAIEIIIEAATMATGHTKTTMTAQVFKITEIEVQGLMSVMMIAIGQITNQDTILRMIKESFSKSYL